MGVFLYSVALISISVVLSTIVNVLIMRKTTEIVVEEINKIESRFLKLVNNVIKK